MDRLTYKENGKWCIELHEGIVHTGPKVDYIARLENIEANAMTLCDSLEMVMRALNIACEYLVHAGACKYKDKAQCQKERKTTGDCTMCVGKVMVERAKEELKLI